MGADIGAAPVEGGRILVGGSRFRRIGIGRLCLLQAGYGKKGDAEPEGKYVTLLHSVAPWSGLGAG
ncbi:hypothetical protein D3C72_2283350 [compost metagenome]